MASKKHVHKYYKLRDGLWHCALPDCTHFMPHNVADQVEGKRSICWGCNEPFIMGASLMENDRPECFECSTGVDADALDKLLKEKGL